MKKKHFLKLPEYPGGKEEFRKYILENLKYPEEARKNRVEGIVHMSAEINDNGEVVNAKIEKGIGFGCDEEALRLIYDAHFGEVKNRGHRVKTKKKFRIQFKLKENKIIQNNNLSNIQYSYQPKEPEQGNNNFPNKYSYTINL